LACALAGENDNDKEKPVTKTRSISLVAAVAALGLTAMIATLAFSGVVSGAASVPAAARQNAAPASGTSLAGALFVVSHVDLVPDALAADKSALQQYAADSRKDPGALRIELLQQSDRPNHFTIVSVWASEKAFNAHLAAAHTRAFRAKIQSGLGSPFDERLHQLVP
jgi:quinol monooxygenase YgiN